MIARTVMRQINRIQPKNATATSQKPMIPFYAKGPPWKNGNSTPGRNRIATQMVV